MTTLPERLLARADQLCGPEGPNTATLLREAAAALQAAPEGWVLVPREPTEAMLRPFYECPPEELELAWEAACFIGSKLTTQQQGGEQEAGDGVTDDIVERACEAYLAEAKRQNFNPSEVWARSQQAKDWMRAALTAALRSKPAASEGDGPTPQVGTARYMDGQYWFPQSAMERFGLAVADAREKRLANTSKQAAVEAVAWCSLTPNGKIGFFDGKPMVMAGPVGNEHHPDPLYTTPPRHPADKGASANSYYAEKAREQRDVAVLDKYADIARALGFPCDTWFGDPLASHEDIVARAKALAALQAGTPT